MQLVARWYVRGSGSHRFDFHVALLQERTAVHEVVAARRRRFEPVQAADQTSRRQ